MATVTKKVILKGKINSLTIHSNSGSFSQNSLFLLEMPPPKSGTTYVGWQFRVPATFWNKAWAQESYGDDWSTTEWLTTITYHRPKGKSSQEEWGFVWPVDGEEYVLLKRHVNKYIKEGRLTGHPHVLSHLFSFPCVWYVCKVCAHSH